MRLPHGTVGAYRHEDCRCADCTHANTAYQRAYRDARRNGQPLPDYGRVWVREPFAKHPLLRAAPTPTLDQLRERALKAPTQPVRQALTSVRTIRDARVREYVLGRAGGRCEHCGQKFLYLEVHHVHAVADGGADTPENAIALDPNCHAVADRNRYFNRLVRRSLQRILVAAA